MRLWLVRRNRKPWNLVARLVSRDTAHLDEAGILRALIETVTENVSDGIVAPIFYLAVAGPLGAMVGQAQMNWSNSHDARLDMKSIGGQGIGGTVARPASKVANVE